MTTAVDKKHAGVTAIPRVPGLPRWRRLRAGLAAAAVHYAVLFAGLAPLGPVEASTLGAAAALPLGWWLARQGDPPHSRQAGVSLARATVVVAVGLGVNAAILSLMILSLPVLQSQLVASACVCLAAYVLIDPW